MKNGDKVPVHLCTVCNSEDNSWTIIDDEDTVCIKCAKNIGLPIGKWYNGKNEQTGKATKI